MDVPSVCLLANLPLLAVGAVIHDISALRWLRRSVAVLCCVGLAVYAGRANQPEWCLTAAALLDQLVSTMPQIRNLFPAGRIVSPVAVLSLVAAYLVGGDLRTTAGLTVGRVDGWPLAWATLCCLLSAAALVSWSVFWVRGDHGPIQDTLGHMLTWSNFIAFAAFNAVREEIEFRMLLMGGLLVSGGTHQAAISSPKWLCAVVLLQAAYFAACHVAGGFPSGRAGGALVFVWGTFLGTLRVWTGGMGLVLCLHFQADVVIFVLLLIEGRRQQKEI